MRTTYYYSFPEILFIKKAKQLYLPMFLPYLPEDLRKVLERYCESQKLYLNARFVQGILGCSKPTARKKLLQLATLLNVRPEWLRSPKNGCSTRNKGYRFTPLDVVYSLRRWGNED